MFGRLLEAEMSKKCTPRYGAKHILKSKCTKHLSFGPLLEVAMSKKCTPLWREAHFQVKMYKARHSWTTFWKLRCRKSARRCGAKHISKSKCTRHTSSGPLLEVEVSKADVALIGAKRISKSNVEKTAEFGALLDVRMSFCVAGTRDSASCQKWAKRKGFVAVSITTTTTLHYSTLRFTLLHYLQLHHTTLQLQLQLRYTTLITLHYTNYITLHYTTLHYTNYNQNYSFNYNYTTLHYTEYITLHSITPHYTTPHHNNYNYSYNYATLHYTRVHYITLPYITLHYTHYKCNCNYTTLSTLHHNYNYNSTTLQLQLHYTTLHPAVVGEVTKHNSNVLQPPLSPSVGSLCHPWFTTTNLSYRFPILKLPPPPCAVLVNSITVKYLSPLIIIFSTNSSSLKLILATIPDLPRIAAQTFTQRLLGVQLA